MVGQKKTNKLLAEVAEAYKSGKTTTEIAEEYKITKATAAAWLREVGIEPERKDGLFQAKVMTTEDVINIIQEFQSGTGIKEICLRFGFSYRAVAKLLENEGLKYSTDNKPINNRETKIIQAGDQQRKILGLDDQQKLCVQYVETAVTKQELAEEFGISIDTVTAILRRNKFDIKKYIPEDIKAQILEDFKSSYSIVDLADLYQTSPETIRYWLLKERLIDSEYIETDENSKKVNTGDFRKLAKEKSPRALEILDKIMNDTNVPPRDRAMACKLIIENAHGRPREQKEEEEDTSSSASKILKLIKN